MDPPFALDQPLPAELTGRAHGWATRYRRYPVFSAPWVRGRLRLTGLVAALVLGSLLLSVLANAPADRPWGGVLHVALDLVVPLVAGPLLGLWVRRRGWDARREGAALLAALLAVVVGLGVFDRVAAEPMKQWVAERTGNVDAQGRRRQVVMTIGINIFTPEDLSRDAARSAADLAQREAPLTAVFSAFVRGLAAFLLAGGVALRGWQRERAGLAALARERELAEARAQRREAELRLSVLAAQVEPHFLFNTLAGVRSAIATDPARASEMVDRLADYLRASIPRLRSDGSAQASVGAQFEIVRAYLALMSARMPRLSFDVQAPPELLRARCPPLMLISLAENAVKHGVEMKIGPARIEVGAARTADGRLALTVTDDGVGFGTSQAGSGIGLANIRERLAQLHGDSAALELKARAEGGVAATLTVPLELDA